MNKIRDTQALILLSLGYLVDFFDLTLFAAARAQILQSFHVEPNNILHVSRLMFNAQAIGIVLGGLLSGMWADKIGRMFSVRIGIFLYSTAIILSVFTTSVDMFVFLRFLAGVGLAGELAASVTYVTEVSEGRSRDIRTSIIYFSGVIGGILASVLSAFVAWKTLFLIGGSAGFVLLFFRLSIKDPSLFQQVKLNSAIRRGSLKLLFFQKSSLIRVIGFIALLVPFWFMVFFINFGPEIAKQIGLKGVLPKQSLLLGCFFVGSVVGTYLFAYLAGILKSRKKTILTGFCVMFTTILLFSFGSYMQLWHFYALIFILGIVCGYPGIYSVFAAESFGINQRATGTAFVACMGRGSIVLINFLVPLAMTIFLTPWAGIMMSNICVFLLGLFALSMLKETHFVNVDYIESVNFIESPK